MNGQGESVTGAAENPQLLLRRVITGGRTKIGDPGLPKDEEFKSALTMPYGAP